MRLECLRYTVPVAAVVGLAIVACGRTTETTSPATITTTTTAARALPRDHAIDRLTTARCDHELTCNGIGKGRTYEDRAACTHEVGQSIEASLPVQDCPAGVDPTKLDTCAGDLRSQACGIPIASLGSVPSCRTNQLCVTTP